MKVWVVYEHFDDGGAAGDFLKDIFLNESDADKCIEEDKKRWGGITECEKKLWDVK